MAKRKLKITHTAPIIILLDTTDAREKHWSEALDVDRPSHDTPHPRPRGVQESVCLPECQVTPVLPGDLGSPTGHPGLFLTPSWLWAHQQMSSG